MSKGERIAVISLLAVITVLLAFSVFRPAIRFSSKEEQAFHNLDSMIALQERKTHEAQQLSSNQETGGTTPSQPNSTQPSPSNSKKTSGKSTAYQTVETPKHTESQSHDAKRPAVSPSIPILDINVTDSLELVALPQIGEVMASRIQRYRERLGGFVSMDQLYEVKGMDSARFATIQPYIILENKKIRKLEVNRDKFKTLLRHPYLEYDQVKAIVNHRERKGLIKNWEQLKGITDEVNPFLEHYIRY